MHTYRHGKTVQARASDGRFRNWTGDDFGIGVCPKCNTVTTQPPKPAELEGGGMIDPFAFNRWRNARVCASCGWTNQT